MNIKYLFSVLLIGLFWGCGNENPTDKTDSDGINENQIVDEAENEWETIEVNDGGYKLSIKIPNEKIAQGKSQVIYHEDIGELEVKVGGIYDLFILEDESQLSMVKNEISDHPFFKVEIVLENDSSLLYRYYQEEVVGDRWHIYAERKIGASMLLIRSNEEREFSEYEAKKMLESVLSITPL